MPRASEKAKLGEKYDKRIKIPKEEHTIIVNKYKTGRYTHRSLAEEYGVSKKLIFLILNPERSQKNDWAKYYDKDKHRAAVKKHRERKEQLYKSGLIEITNNN